MASMESRVSLSGYKTYRSDIIANVQQLTHLWYQTMRGVTIGPTLDPIFALPGATYPSCVRLAEICSTP